MSTQAWESLPRELRERIVGGALDRAHARWRAYAPAWASLDDANEKYMRHYEYVSPDTTSAYPNAGPRGATDPKDLVARPNADGVWEV